MLNAPPNPVSISSKRGKSVACVILLASSTTSFKVVIARSGNPKDALATPAPDKYSALCPADSAILAQYALTAPTTTKGLLSAMACLNFLPGVFIDCYCTLQR